MRKTIYCFLTLAMLAGSINAQTQVKCGSEQVRSFLENNSFTKVNVRYNDSVTHLFLNDPQKIAKAASNTYVIPVVFHVFAANAQALVPLAQIQSGLNKINEDFNALNADYNTIDPEFSARASSLNIQFALAQKDTNGNFTTGVTYHPKDSGFATTTAAMNAKIASFAWPNYKYMNIYIMLDLFGDGVHNNSGVGFYPNTWDSDNRVDRIVYNYWYLGNTGSSIADGEFQSVLTHEYGHWLNLKHTFGSNCVDYDGIADTPPSDVAAGGCGPNAFHCSGNINGENYMDYNATCYKMYTQGQVNVMLAALQLPTRFPLWQQANLIATGLDQYTSVKNIPADKKIQYSVSDNNLKTNADKAILYDFYGKILFEKNCSDPVQLGEYASGVYILALMKNDKREFHKIILQK